jgi:hypothetical protein
MASKTLGISEFITRIKKDLLADQVQQEESALFSIDEVTIEINLVITGDIDSGFNFGVVTLGSKVSEERVQKVIIKMTPLVTKEQLINSNNKNPEIAIEKKAFIRTFNDDMKE